MKSILFFITILLLTIPCARAQQYTKQQLQDSLRDVREKFLVDSDQDGVPDYYDREPNTPQGYQVYGSGISVDSDKDGVPDGRDNDLFTPKGCTVNTSGMPADDDGDGVPNCLDKEANTPHGNLINFQGVTFPKGGASSYQPEYVDGVQLISEPANAEKYLVPIWEFNKVLGLAITQPDNIEGVKKIMKSYVTWHIGKSNEPFSCEMAKYKAIFISSDQMLVRDFPLTKENKVLQVKF